MNPQSGSTAEGASVRVVPVHPGDRARIRQFIDLPFEVYRDTPQWVPPFRSQLRRLLERRHPFFRHSAAQPLLALRGGRPVGRLTVFECGGRGTEVSRSEARFSHFECREDPQAATAIFEAAAAWARSRGCRDLAGPYGLSSMDGGGILVDGFAHRASMTMMPYHPPYYRGLLESWGFAKDRDLYTAVVEREGFELPDKVRRVAEAALKRGRFSIPGFRTKRELLAMADGIGEVYNRAFVSHDDFTPISPEQIRGLAREIARVTRPSLVKLLLYDGELAGFLLTFPDLSGALQRAGGRLTPWSLVDLATEWRRTEMLIVNGAGILPEYQRLGGNALLYHELCRTVMRSGYRRAEMVQIADTTSLMLRDMQTLGGRIHKTHRVFRRSL